MSARRRNGQQHGFTYVELVLIVGIIGVLVAIAFASYQFTVERTRRITCLANQRNLNQASVQYQLEHNGQYAPLIDDVAAYAKDFAKVRRCTAPPPLDLVYDPASGRLTCPRHPLE